MNELKKNIKRKLLENITLIKTLDVPFLASIFIFLFLFTVVIISGILSGNYTKIFHFTPVVFIASFLQFLFFLIFNYISIKDGEIPEFFDYKKHFKNSTFSLEELQIYFNKVNNLGISADELNSFISKRSEEFRLEFGNKAVMLTALIDAIELLEKREGDNKYNKEIIKTYISK